MAWLSEAMPRMVQPGLAECRMRATWTSEYWCGETALGSDETGAVLVDWPDMLEVMQRVRGVNE